MEQIALDRLTGIVAFARAASLGSYTAAARSLSVSPSAVSKSVQRLEQHFGLTLFTRTTRSLTLTPEGQDLLKHAQRLLLEADELEQVVLNAKAEPAGILKVTAPLPVGVHILAPALAAFRHRYPKVNIDLRLGDQYLDIVDERIDIAIRAGDPGDSRLVSRRLAPHRVGLFASPAYLASRGTPLKPEDLQTHDCVNFRFQSSGQVAKWPFQTGNDRKYDMLPQAGITVDVSDAVAAALVTGAGIGLSPTYVAASYVKRGELTPVLPQFTRETFPLTALWPESRRGNPAVKAFIGHLLDLFPTPTPWDKVINNAQRPSDSPFVSQS